MEPLIETWHINNRINLYLLDAIEESALEIALAKGKRVGDQLAHVHNVRLMWLKASAPELMQGLEKLEKGAFGKQELRQALEASGRAIEELVRAAQTPDGRIKGFKPHATAFVGYMIAHESFHRAHLELALRQAGAALPDKVAYGMWEWGVR